MTGTKNVLVAKVIASREHMMWFRDSRGISWIFFISIKFGVDFESLFSTKTFLLWPNLPRYVEMKENTEDNTFSQRQTLSSFQLPLFSTNKIKLWIWSRWKTRSLTSRDLRLSEVTAYWSFLQLWIMTSTIYTSCSLTRSRGARHGARVTRHKSPCQWRDTGINEIKGADADLQLETQRSKDPLKYGSLTSSVIITHRKKVCGKFSGRKWQKQRGVEM